MVIGQFFMGIALGAIPFGHSIYPWFFCCRQFGMIGAGTALNILLLPDYIHKDSIGRASAYANVVMLVSSIFVVVGVFQIAAHINDPKYIYYTASCFSFLITIFLSYAIKDVIKGEKDDY